MFITALVLSILLALVCLGSGFPKLTKAPAMVEQLGKLGVKESQLPILGALLAAGAIGLVVGLWWAPIGIAAAACLALYFALAAVTHLRHNDPRGVLPTGILTVLALATLIFRIASA